MSPEIDEAKDPEDVEQLPDDPEARKALKGVLEEMTSVYSTEGEPLEVKFAEGSFADRDGKFVAVEPNFPEKVDPDVKGPNILRVLDDLLAHEMGHINWSDLRSKSVFSNAYEGWGKIPGYVANVLEDEYDDAKRMGEWYGMRSKCAYRKWLQMQTDTMAPNVHEVDRRKGRTNAIMAALYQTAIGGYVKGIEEADDEIAEFCAQAEPIVKRVRTQDDKKQRFKLFHAMMQLVMRYIPDPEEFDDEWFEDGPGSATSGDAGDSGSGDADVDLDDEEKEELKEMIEKMIEEGELDPSDFSGDGDPDGIEIEVETSPDFGDDGGEEDGDEEAAERESEESHEEDLFDDLESGGDEDADSGEEDPEDEDSEVESETGSDADSDEDDADDETEADESPDKETPGDSGTGDMRSKTGVPPTEHKPDGSTSEEAEEFKERDESEIEDRFDVDIDEIEKADKRDRTRWATLVKKLQEYGTDVEERKRERDDRVESNQDYWGEEHRKYHERLKKRAERAGVIRELKEGFEELVSRPSPKPSRTGPRLDVQNTVRRAAGDHTVTELFEEPRITETGDRCIGVATDISGSMGSDINELKIAGAAVAKATSIIGDEFVWEAFTDRPRHHGTSKALDLRIVTGPDEDFKWEHLDSFDSARNEPTAAGIRDCRSLMEMTDAREYVMIVITDGVALITEDGKKPHSNEPVEQARKAVNECRRDGVDVIGLGIGSMDEYDMERTFGGGNYRLTDVDSMAGDILDLYRDQLSTT